MKRLFSLITFLGLLGLAMNLSAQQTPSSPDQTGTASQQQAQPPAQQPVDAQSQQAARSFEGKITKAGDKLVLQDASTQTSYQLDDQDKVKQFEGQSVKITATMDAPTNTLHVVDISPSAK
jgi:hypothetical protein